MNSKRKIITLIIAVVAFILFAGGAFRWSSAQIERGIMESIGDRAQGYASLAAQNVDLSDEQVNRLKGLSYEELLKSPENQKLQEFFAHDVLRNQVDYAYLMVRLGDSQTPYKVTVDTADNYDAPVGTPLNVLWLLDVSINADTQAASAKSAQDMGDISRYGYWTEEDDRIFENAPLYVVNDDEWGRHICGYAPVYSSEGTFIGMMGVDIKTSSYEKYYQTATITLIVFLAVVVVILSVIFLLFMRRERREHLAKHLQEERVKILEQTNTPTFDYDPVTDTLTHSYFGEDGGLEERTVHDYRGMLSSVTNVRGDQVADLRAKLREACSAPGHDSLSLKIDLGKGLRWYNLDFVSVADDKNAVYRVVGRLDDVERERAMEKRASYDALSGALNRAEAEVRIEQRFPRSDVQSAFILVDVDNFKGINDTMGHAAGDEVIRYMGQALLACFRSEDVAYRLGGDEFAAFLQGPKLAGIVQMKADSLQRDINCHFEKQEWEIPVTLSIGIAIAEPDSAESFDNLYRRADEALYQAKENGKAQYFLDDGSEDSSSNEDAAAQSNQD